MRLWCGWREPGRGWFRLFGVGLYWKDVRRHRLTFSQRYGRERLSIQLWHWRLKILKYKDVS
jgi:hypothetical protein